MVELNPQHAYARWLGRGSRLGFGLLVAAFVAYILGLLPAQIAIESLPQYWNLSAAEYMERAGIPTGWGWLAFAGRGDMLNLVGIVVLAGCSVPCLAAAIPAFRAQGDRAFVWICVAEIAVLVLAASGFVSLH